MEEKTFDPSGTGVNNGNFFGFPYSLAQSTVVVYPVEWDVTTSYGGGASSAAKAILEASPQLDFYDFNTPNAWLTKIGTVQPNPNISQLNTPSRALAIKVIEALENGKNIGDLRQNIAHINTVSQTMVDTVQQDTYNLLQDGKKVVLLGGDHSTPLGYIRALAKINNEFGILHLDAHADLRCAYEGFEYSHASVMYNVMKLPQVSRLTQVAVRDICPDEIEMIEKSGGRVVLFDDYKLNTAQFEGKTWSALCQEIIATLPQMVYVSFDIDALNPSLCPGTGTPVAGGLSFEKAVFLLAELHRSGKTVIGADLNEVCPSSDDNDWDANVGARILYKLCLLLG